MMKNKKGKLEYTSNESKYIKKGTKLHDENPHLKYRKYLKGKKI
jgi:hypothetical protein